MDNNLIQKTALGSAIEQYKDRLLAIIACHASEKLKRLMTIEDLLQEVYLAAYKRLDYLNDNPDVSLLVKLRTIALQTIVDKERYYGADKRDVNKEIYDKNDDSHNKMLNNLADSVTSPSKKMMRSERAALVHRLLNEMSPEDREIISLRHFEQMDYKECAQILGITSNAATMRYVRAIKRLKELVEQISELKP